MQTTALNGSLLYIKDLKIEKKNILYITGFTAVFCFIAFIIVLPLYAQYALLNSADSRFIIFTPIAELYKN